MVKALSNPPGGIQQTTLVYRDDGSALVEQTQVEIFVGEGRDAGRSAVLTASPIVIGTHREAGFQLADQAVSRRHAELSLQGDGVRVRDLGSTNGTLVGTSRVVDAVVPLGSTLTVGETKLEVRRLVDRYPVPISRRRRFGDLIGSSTAMRQVYALLELAAGTDATVLIEGETGTGKELAARALHDYSARAREPFEVVDCGAVSPTLIEAELFGHEKGAFTGADRERAGAFEKAHGGTLFFDEIGELPQNLQPKLLRALESRQIQRIGGARQIAIDVRFVAATNRALDQEVERGRFRQDLYFRLNVFKVVLPPLRDHLDDVPLLVKHFLSPYAETPLSDEILTRMAQHTWPGNVRELRNAVERAVILARDASHHRGDGAGEDSPEAAAQIDFDASRPFKEVKADLIESFEKAYLEQVLARNNGNVSASARQSGIDRKHLERLVRKHGIKIIR